MSLGTVAVLTNAPKDCTMARALKWYLGRRTRGRLIAFLEALRTLRG